MQEEEKKGLGYRFKNARKIRSEDKDNHAIGFSNGWNSAENSQHEFSKEDRAIKKTTKGYKKGVKYRIYCNKQFRRAKRLNYGRK